MRNENLIAGKWIAGAGARFAVRDPAYGDVTWEGGAADAAQAQAAIAAARAAFPRWARTPIAAREAIARAYAAAIKKREDDLARAISKEMGKPLWESRSEVAAVIGKIEISIRARSERAGEREEKAAFGALTLAHRPHGVLAVFGPFNFPAHLPNGHIVPALLAGNAIVFKPSELAPSAGALMAEAWEEAGLPPGVLNLVQGGRSVGEALLDCADLNGVLFTGSAAAGVSIHKRFAGRPDILLALEMGGDNPLIAWPPAGPDAAANLIAHSAWSTSGQRCSCARRLFLPAGAFGDAVLERLAALGAGLSVGGWKQSPEPFMGPLVSEAAAERLARVEARYRAMGGVSLLSFDRQGAFLRPALMDMTATAAPPDDEVFAPFLQVFRVATIEQAFAGAAHTAFGLAGGLISDDADLWARAQEEMRAGVLNWNRPTTGASSALPFGGPGLSGDLRPSAYYAADYCAYPVASQTAARAAPITAPGLP